jgi:hypothetical protein
LTLFVPPVQLSRGRLHLRVQFDEHYEYSINSVKEVHIQHDPYVVLIQTDKPVYKPGQEVRFRVLTLTHDLMPVTGLVSGTAQTNRLLTSADQTCSSAS